jgi:hypothetical protein
MHATAAAAAAAAAVAAAGCTKPCMVAACMVYWRVMRWATCICNCWPAAVIHRDPLLPLLLPSAVPLAVPLLCEPTHQLQQRAVCPPTTAQQPHCCKATDAVVSNQVLQTGRVCCSAAHRRMQLIMISASVATRPGMYCSGRWSTSSSDSSTTSGSRVDGCEGRACTHTHTHMASAMLLLACDPCMLLFHAAHFDEQHWWEQQ